MYIRYNLHIHYIYTCYNGYNAGGAQQHRVIATDSSPLGFSTGPPVFSVLLHLASVGMHDLFFFFGSVWIWGFPKMVLPNNHGFSY